MKDPFDPLVEQIAQMMELVQKQILNPENKDKPIPEETMLLLQNLEAQVRIFSDAANHLDVDLREKAVETQLSSQQKQFLKQLDQLSKDASEYKTACDLLENIDKPPSQPTNPTEKKKQIQKRQRKFRGLGGKGGWTQV